jgi:hypothetical protein
MGCARPYSIDTLRSVYVTGEVHPKSDYAIKISAKDVNTNRENVIQSAAKYLLMAESRD